MSFKLRTQAPAAAAVAAAGGSGAAPLSLLGADLLFCWAGIQCHRGPKDHINIILETL